MAIESATYVSDLNTSNPPAGDPVGQACDHIRLIKSTLKSTFPNIVGAASALSNEKVNNGALPSGIICLWSGATTAVPTGWALCDGGSYAAADGSGNVTAPDLRDLMIMGAGKTYAALATGGAASATPTITVANTTLTTDQIPSHNHGVNDPTHSHTAYQDAHAHSVGGGCSVKNGTSGTTYGAAYDNTLYTNTVEPGVHVGAAGTGISIQNNGGGNPHNHTATSSAVATVPPFIALGYIIRL